MAKGITIKAAKAVHPLAPAVLRQLGGGRQAVEAAIEAGNHGADAGWSGFTYYIDTDRFYRRNERAIMDCVREDAREFGEDSVSSFLASFRCLRDCSIGVPEIDAWLCDSADDDTDTMIHNALAWYALETVGRRIADEVLA